MITTTTSRLLVIKAWQSGPVRIAGILTKSDGYPVHDLPMMAGILVDHVIAVCEHEGVRPNGSLEIEPINTWDDTDSGFRWQLALA